jgi:hypothetical protein
LRTPKNRSIEKQQNKFLINRESKSGGRKLLKLIRMKITAKEEKSDVSNKVLHIEEDSLDIDYSSILKSYTSVYQNIGAVAQHIQKKVWNMFVSDSRRISEKDLMPGNIFYYGKNSKNWKSLWPTLMQVSEKRTQSKLLRHYQSNHKKFFFRENPFQDIFS